MNIFVGNLNYRLQVEALEQLFAEYGQVDSAKIITDRETGRAKGFGFVEMSNETEAQAAIDGLNGSEVMGRALVVNVARPRD
ncbi:MAG: RNA-binding protein [Flavobacteriales bacterium]